MVWLWYLLKLIIAIPIGFALAYGLPYLWVLFSILIEKQDKN